MSVFLKSLLPLRAVVVSLQLGHPARFSFFHNGPLHAFVRHRCQAGENFSRYLRVNPIEKGRVRYQAGETYRFQVICLPGGEPYLDGFLRYLLLSPVKRERSARPIGSDSTLVSIRCALSGVDVQRSDQCQLFDTEAFEAECHYWQSRPLTERFRLRFVSPARILISQYREQGLTGENRFCHNGQGLSLSHFILRCHDAIAKTLVKPDSPPKRPDVTDQSFRRSHFFWSSTGYTNSNGKYLARGGVCGEAYADAGDIAAHEWPLIIMSQYIGIGQMSGFGYGAFCIETTAGQSMRADRSGDTMKSGRSCLVDATDPDIIDAAHRAIESNRQSRKEEFGQFENDETTSSGSYHDEIRSRLLDAASSTSFLYGTVISDPDGDLRALAVPSFAERVAQRAVVEVMTPACDDLASSASHGYRRGRSRMSARDAIQRAWREGYRWVFETDIESFFDVLDWQEIEARLRCLFDDPALTSRLMRWVRAPVWYNDQIINRSAGLPQGAPVSPLLANLVLDTLDDIVEREGFRLVRYSDDFVIVCKSQDRAVEARQRTREILNSLGLSMNEDKTAIVPFDVGFRYLGYRFVNDLVVDSPAGSQTTAGPEKPADTPTGWLAELARLTAKPITSSGEIDTDAMSGETVAEDQTHQDHWLDEAEAASTGALSDDAELPDDAAVSVGTRTEAGTTVIVTGSPATVATRQHRMTLSRDNEQLREMAWSQLQSIVLFGFHHMTAGAIREALKNDVSVYFASSWGRFQGTLANGKTGQRGTDLWIRQLEVAQDSSRALTLAKAIVRARIRNQRETLRRHEAAPTIEAIRRQLDESVERVESCMTAVELNGVEGFAARSYFRGLAALLPPEFPFEGRNRRPPTDPFNALLSFGYTVLYGHADVLIRSVGLLPTAGLYHQSRGRHAALASDMIEPFRHVVEGYALHVLGKAGFRCEDFTHDAARGCRLSPASRRRYLAGLEEQLTRPLAGRASESRPVIEHLQQQIVSLQDYLDNRGEFEVWRWR